MLTALYADKNGEIFDAPGCLAVGRTGNQERILSLADMIPLPEGAELMYLPGRIPLAGKQGRIQPLTGRRLAVAAMLPVGYTRTYLPAYTKQDGASPLPLFGYTAAALYKDQIYVAATKSDDNAKWHPYRFNTPDLRQKVTRVKRDLPGSRIVAQLADCALKWHCCTAQNLFYRRWEAGIPVSPACNANCLGCISLQPAECCPSPQSRIQFAPTAEEIAAVGIYHLESAPDGMISFGQGCEGEPSLAAGAIAAAIERIRSRTGRGMININTNAGFTGGIRQIVDAGLDSMRVSMISAIPEQYQRYYRGNYHLDNVRESIRYAVENKVYVSLNMLFLPGFNDREEEVRAWKEWLGTTAVDMVQLRNLNMDPDLFLPLMPPPAGKTLGVRRFIEDLAATFPRIAIGSFSKYWRNI
ncbi:radical sam [Lucifera butyrica]|uniref:Radical sam n=1 Tax=Lucifera butyrica TaxID=1351585 RepID=A0A498R589_9FIRM|nr:radical SAM protein [Lucifera butyrica]VBB06551.1 radical sam [Lucifera butyrica]